MEVTSLQAIVKLLGASLGEEAARTAVEAEARVSGLGQHLTTAEGVELLKRLESRGGPVGLAARLVLSKLGRFSAKASGTFTAVAPADKIVTLGELERLLAIGLGGPRAHEVVQQAAAFLCVIGPEVTKDEALKLLDLIEETHPNASSAARFTKVKVLLLQT
jgi:hypothetical protein